MVLESRGNKKSTVGNPRVVKECDCREGQVAIQPVGMSDEVGYVKRGLAARTNRGGGELKRDKEAGAESESATRDESRRKEDQKSEKSS